MIPLNTQPTEKQVVFEDGSLQIINLWYTIQGEGPYAGTPAIFVRLAGCNLQCPECDTDYTTDRKTFTPLDLALWTQTSFMQSAMCNPRMVVITGGEPFRQNIAPFVRNLKTRYGTEFPVQVETNGTLALDDFPYSTTCVVCSPKAPQVAKQLVPWIRHLKYVVEAGHVDAQDGLPTSVLGNGLRPMRPWPGFRYQGTVWVQPADVQDPVRNKENTEEAVRVCMRYGYRLCLQVHKIVGLE